MTKSLEDIISEKISRLDSVPDKYAAEVKKLQQDLMDKFSDLMEQLGRTEEGTLKLTKKNLLVISDILNDFKKYFSRSDYFQLTKAFISEFDTQANLTNTFFEKSFDEFTDPDSFSIAALERAKKQSYILMAGTPTITVNLYQPLETILIDAVTAGDSYVKTVKSIRRVITGDNEVDGKLYKYAKQIAYDSFAVADRGYTNNIAEDIGVEWYVYRGGLVEDSRCFCKERNGKYFHKKEIEGFGAGIGVGDCGYPWQGMMPTTTSKTIFIVAAGWNCRHSWLPTSISVVPKTVIKRNIKAGNVSLTDKQKEILEL